MVNYRKSKLIPRTRVHFDPANKKHVLDFARFIKYDNWKEGCSYYLEDPYTNIPAMIQAKIADHALAKYLEKV